MTARYDWNKEVPALTGNVMHDHVIPWAIAFALFFALAMIDRLNTYLELRSCATDYECQKACERAQLKDCEDVMGKKESAADDEDGYKFVRI